jgi:hypothetical protein
MTYRLFAALLMLVIVEVPALAVTVKTQPKADKAADPEATKLLAEARAARAQWDTFPGFRAKITIDLDGKVIKGTVEVTPKGKVTIQARGEEKSEGVEWARGQLAQTVSHRLVNGTSAETPCAFVDDNKDHPLGRAIRVLNDEFHSSYRVRDRQVIVVNRQMKDSRFTITVMENKLNKEKKYLPSCYVVNTWDGKTDALSSSAAYHHTWKRVGDYDLPSTLTVVTTTAGSASGQSARSLRLTTHDLLK